MPLDDRRMEEEEEKKKKKKKKKKKTFPYYISVYSGWLRQEEGSVGCNV